MSTPKQTQDEQFMIQLYKMAMGKGNPFSEVDLLAVATTLRMRETATRTIVRDLAQANFIRKFGDDTLCLTQRGADLVLDLL